MAHIFDQTKQPRMYVVVIISEAKNIRPDKITEILKMRITTRPQTTF